MVLASKNLPQVGNVGVNFVCDLEIENYASQNTRGEPNLQYEIKKLCFGKYFHAKIITTMFVLQNVWKFWI